MTAKEIIEKSPDLLHYALSSTDAYKQVSKSLGYDKTAKTVARHHPLQSILEWGEDDKGNIVATAVYTDIPHQISITVKKEEIQSLQQLSELCC